MGTGTLYRNFPTREALIEAAYRNEVARLCDAVPDLLATMPPREALRAWMGRFIDYATAKLGMADALRAVVASGTNPYAHSHEMIQAALSSLMDAGIAAGAIRSDIGPTDMKALSSITARPTTRHLNEVGGAWSQYAAGDHGKPLPRLAAPRTRDSYIREPTSINQQIAGYTTPCRPRGRPARRGRSRR
jgi:AcrR family transcriptional regulator